MDQAVLDACVLVPPTLCDLLLRLAEEPALYRPRWSEEILDEVYRNQTRIAFSETRAQSWRQAVARLFPEATVTDYRSLLDRCENYPKDRHVLAAAIRCAAKLIVTCNLRDFPDAALARWDVSAIHPDPFLIALYLGEPEGVRMRLIQMSADRNIGLDVILVNLKKVVPNFVDRVVRDLDLTPEP